MSLVSVSRAALTHPDLPAYEDPLLVEGAAKDLLVIGGVIDSAVSQNGEGFTWIPDGELHSVAGEKETWLPQEGAGRISFLPNAFASVPSVLVTAEGQGLLSSGTHANIPIGIVETSSRTLNTGGGVDITMVDTQTSAPKSCHFHFIAFGVAA